MLEVQKYLQNHTLDQLEEEFGVLIKRYDDRVTLNYKMDSRPKYHPLVKECRGLILSYPDYNVLCRSFDRFYNYGEGEDHIGFNWQNSTIMTKLDGSLINFYHDGNEWICTTRGTAWGEGTTDFGENFTNLVKQAINNVDIKEFCKNFHKEYTYIFELTSPYNRVVVQYKDVKLTLLAVRNKITGDYIDYSILKGMVKHIIPEGCNVELVKMYDFTNPDDIISFVESQRGVEQEGVVCYDNFTQKRIKIKSSDYTALHHLRGEFSKKSFVKLLLKGEEDEFINYFPEYKEKLYPYINRLNELKYSVEDTYDRYRDIEDQKEFALKVKDLPYSGFVFAMRKGKTLADMFNVDNLNKVLKFFEDL